IYHSVELLRYIPLSAQYYPPVYSLFGLTGNSLLRWNLVSMALVIVGNSLTFLGIISLRRSFSIMVEAREAVFTGPYAYVRHPLYVGEIVATAGVLVFRFSPVNAALFVLFIVSQIVRAALEEKKLLSVFPAYEDYRRKTGAFFPRFPRS
ncbi:MAG TPA: isoprenylcysteine carboxylmethyltransferase family protein, partial [Nitrospirota bacterium]